MESDRLKGMNIYLVGMMGSGKTTIGKCLASKIEYRFFDTDLLIEKVTQSSINEIFAQEGEATFRQLETQILEQLCAYTRAVIATGGGIVLKPKNWSYLRHGLVIWLNSPVEILYQRLITNKTRPLLKEGNLLDKLTNLTQQRRAFYAQADLVIDTASEQNPEIIANSILEQIPTVLK